MKVYKHTADELGLDNEHDETEWLNLRCMADGRVWVDRGGEPALTPDDCKLVAEFLSGGRPALAEQKEAAKVDTFLNLVLACGDAKLAQAIDGRIQALIQEANNDTH